MSSAKDDACHGSVAISDFGTDGRIGAKRDAATRTIAFGRTQADGDFHTFIANADGSDEQGDQAGPVAGAAGDLQHAGSVEDRRRPRFDRAQIGLSLGLSSRRPCSAARAAW